MMDLDIDNALKIISNDYRREILRLLTIEDRYAFELSKYLNISQRAVKKHLDFLKEMGIVQSERRKSTEGPEREYFKLYRAVIVSFTMAPNLFRSSVRALDEDHANLPQITPALQLDVPDKGTYDEIISEGLSLLPQIKEGLDLLQLQQNKLLRAYQGIQGHIGDFLKEDGFDRDEISVILVLIENEGHATNSEVQISLGKQSDLPEVLNRLERKNIILTKIEQLGNDIITHIELINI